MISAEEFRQLAAAGHNRIPVVREVLSDLDTPLSVYLKLADGPHTYLFESVEGGETWGRYSIIGLPAQRAYTFRGNTLEVREHGELVETRELADPLAEVDRLREQLQGAARAGPAGLHRRPGRLFRLRVASATSSRACARRRQARPTRHARCIPDAVSEELAVFDNLKGRLYLIVHADPAEPQAYATRRIAASTNWSTACAIPAAAIRTCSTRRCSRKPISSPASPARASSSAVRDSRRNTSAPATSSRSC